MPLVHHGPADVLKGILAQQHAVGRSLHVDPTLGTIGNIGLYSEDVPFDNIRINSGMLIFRPNKRALLPSFPFELLRSEIVKYQIKKQTTGAAQPQLPIKTLVNFTIPVRTNLEGQLAVVRRLRVLEPESQRLAALYQRKLVALDDLKK